MDIFLSHWKEDPVTWENVPSPPMHREIDQAYESATDTALVLPRWFAKTTRVLANILKDLVYGRRLDIGYLSSADLGMESVGRIRVEIETNDLMQKVFGKLSPEDHSSGKIKKLKKWKQQFLQLVNGNSLETLSPWQRIRWRRKRKRIIDDPDEDTDSRSKRKAFRKFVFTTIYNTMLKGGYMIVIGTIVSVDCFVLYLKNEKKRHTIMYRAIEDGKSIWPELRPLEELEKRKTAIWSLIFNQEFMHVPISAEDALVKLERIKRRDVLPTFERTVLSVDPAKKEKESSDFTGIVYGGIANGKYYVIRSHWVKLSPLKLELYIGWLIKKLKPTYVLKEDNIELGMTERLANNGSPMVWIYASTDKRRRLLEASPWIERGDVLFGKEWDEELIHQLTNYPNIQHDDIMDAFTQFINYGMSVSNSDIYVVT